MRNGDTKQNSCDIIANQRKGDYMKSNLEIQEKLYDFIKYIYPVLRQYRKVKSFRYRKILKIVSWIFYGTSLEPGKARRRKSFYTTRT